MTRTKSIYLALLAVLLSPMAANAVVINVNGIDYDVYSLYGVHYPDEVSLFESQVWWGDSDLARDFALAVSATSGVGSNFDVYGPYIGYAHQLDDGRGWDWVDAWLQTPSGGADPNPPGDPFNYRFAFAERVSVPEPTTLALLGLGLFGMGLARRRRKV